MTVQNIRDGVTVNKEQRLYVIPAGEGYSCLGFDVAFNWTQAIAAELRRDDLRPIKDTVGTLAGYKDYTAAVEAARLYEARTGQRLTCMLSKQLIGLEGRRVEVVTLHDETRRFYVGKSTGWLPCHLEIARRNSNGGISADKEYKSVTVLKGKRG